MDIMSLPYFIVLPRTLVYSHVLPCTPIILPCTPIYFSVLPSTPLYSLVLQKDFEVDEVSLFPPWFFHIKSSANFSSSLKSKVMLLFPTKFHAKTLVFGKLHKLIDNCKEFFTKRKLLP